MASGERAPSERTLPLDAASASANATTSPFPAPIDTDSSAGRKATPGSAPLSETSLPWPPALRQLHRPAIDSLSTTASDSLMTPLSPTAPPPRFGFGAFVDSPTVSNTPPRFLGSPATDGPSFAQRAIVGTHSHKSPLPGKGDVPYRAMGPASRQRPSPLDLQSIETTLDHAEAPFTATSNCSAQSNLSNELLDLSNLRRSIQQNLRDRPLGHGETDFDLESIGESEMSPASPDRARNVSPGNAIAIFQNSPQYLVVDTRVLEEYAPAHIRRSANVSIPTLLLNRLRKQTTRAGIAGWVSLTRYVSTAEGQALWDSVDLHGKWLDLVIIGVDADDTDAPHILAEILEPLVTHGMVRVVEGGWPAIADEARAARLVVSDVAGCGNTDSVVVSAPAPDARAPVGRERAVSGSVLISPATSAPAPSQTNVPAIRPLPTLQSVRSVPNLSINTPSAMTPRRPPKLQLQLDTASAITRSAAQPVTGPHRGNRPKLGGLTIDVGSSRIPTGPQSALPYTTAQQSKPRLAGLSIATGAKTSNLAPPAGEPWNANTSTSTPIAASSNFSNIPPPTPNVATLSTGPAVSRLPLLNPIDISTILPSFLFLGPEITTKADVEELQNLGVKRILNVAIECDDDEGLGLRDAFEKYYRIPMKDSVDESGVSDGIRDACKILDDARLHSSPVYVHCKAGKSRSVTVVLAYLIHANAWSLHTSYQYVSERRPGISPNIGFVAELMEFEAAELGTKQPGREEPASATPTDTGEEPLVPRESRVGPRYTRESLPPEFGSERLADDDSDTSPVEEPAGEHAPEGARHRRKPQPGIEVRKNGQWVLRRTPVDRVTLQPGRRSSKAGLESMVMRPLRRPDA